MFDDSLRAIGERIAARRRARRLTQTALAAAAHVSYATVRSVERGARRPRRRRTGGARLLASAARTADAVAYEHGAHDLSARLIELMRWAADRAADPLVQASASYVRAETFFAACAHEAGLVSLERAIEAAPPPTGRTESAVLGALHRRAAVMASRAGSVDAAETHMAYARHLGEQVALEETYFGTAFGPGSVRVHEVSVAVGLGPGYADRALSAAHPWKPGDDLPTERRSGFCIDLARAQEWAGRPADAFASLKAARAVAPQHTREHPWGREVAGNLRRFHRSDAESLSHFARWVGAV